MKILSLKSRETYQVKHDGKVRTAFVIASPFTAENPNAFFDGNIEIDGAKVNVIAVDLDGDDGIKTGQPISIIGQ